MADETAVKKDEFGEETPAWAAQAMQMNDSLSQRMDALEGSIKSISDAIQAWTKGGIAAGEPAHADRTAEAKDGAASVGEPGASADNGTEAQKMFRQSEAAETEGQAEFAGQNMNPDAPQAAQERLQRSEGAGPNQADKISSLENGVINMNTQGQEQKDMRGHPGTNHAQDALFAKQAAKMAELESQIKRLSKQPTIEERNALAQSRRHADSIYSRLGREAPEPLPGEQPMAYRRRLADGLKDLSPKAKGLSIDGLPDPVFEVTEERIYQDALEAAKRPDITPPMQLRQHRYQDEATGHMVTEYSGDPMAWMSTFMSPGARVDFNRHPDRQTH